MEENKGRNDTLRKRKVNYLILLLLLKNGVKQKGIHKLKQDKWILIKILKNGVKLERFSLLYQTLFPFSFL